MHCWTLLRGAHKLLLILTVVFKVSESHVGWSVVDDISSGEKSKGVKQLEDGVARLVDGEDDDTVRVSA